VNVLLVLIAFIIAYLLGSVPTAVWAGKIFRGIDLREHGSGNAGAANAIRILGWKIGVPVLSIDMAKGWLAAMLPVFFNLAENGTALSTNLQIGTGVTAIIGHILPVFARFRGGKGVATASGVLLAIHPLLTLACLGVFIVVLLSSRIMSVASLSAGIVFPILLFFIFDTPSLLFRIFSIAIALALIFTHRNNIRRLLKGEEKRLF
jgi:glycerol-3-phosphate acyltransferase PlsY